MLKGLFYCGRFKANKPLSCLCMTHVHLTMSSLFSKQKRTTKELEDDNANKNRCSNVRDKTQKITQLYSNVSSWNSCTTYVS